MKIVSELFLCRKRGHNVILQELEGDYHKFCVQYAGCGHYFQTYGDAYKYLVMRKFVKRLRVKEDNP